MRGKPLEVFHHGTRLMLEAKVPLTRPWSDGEEIPDVEPPPGREPSREGIGAEPPPTAY
jgi:hypothetical protein